MTSQAISLAAGSIALFVLARHAYRSRSEPRSALHRWLAVVAGSVAAQCGLTLLSFGFGTDAPAAVGLASAIGPALIALTWPWFTRAVTGIGAREAALCSTGALLLILLAAGAGLSVPEFPADRVALAALLLASVHAVIRMQRPVALALPGLLPAQLLLLVLASFDFVASLLHGGIPLFFAPGFAVFALLLSQATEEKDRARHRELLESEEKYGRLVDESSEIIFSLGKDGRVRSATGALRAHLGLRSSDLVGRPFADLIFEPDESRISFSGALVAQAFSRLEHSNRPVNLQVELRSSQGEPRPVQMRLEKVLVDTDFFYYIVAAPLTVDDLAPFRLESSAHYRIGNDLTLADSLIRRLIADLSGRLPAITLAGVRLGLQEILINAIEHGNLNITFEEKSAVTLEGKLGDLIRERQADPRYRNKKLDVRTYFDTELLEVVVKDEGPGFDHRAMLARKIREEDSYNLLHGRGIALTREQFDSIEYNEAGNEVRLKKRLRLRPRVLVVDDDEDIQNLASLFLRRNGFEYIGAGNIPTALSVAEGAHPEVVLLDLQLAGGSGFEALEEIRKLDRTNHRRTHVIILSGDKDEERVQRAIRSGASDYLAKPFSEKALMHGLNRQRRAEDDIL